MCQRYRRADSTLLRAGVAVLSLRCPSALTHGATLFIIPVRLKCLGFVFLVLYIRVRSLQLTAAIIGEHYCSNTRKEGKKKLKR